MLSVSHWNSDIGIAAFPNSYKRTQQRLQSIDGTAADGIQKYFEKRVNLYDDRLSVLSQDAGELLVDCAEAFLDQNVGTKRGAMVATSATI